MALLTLIRHGQSTYNLENRFTGSLDVPLTALGLQEAHRAGARLKGFTYSAAYTSTMKRAKDTLQIILQEIEQTKTPTIENAALDERMYGSLQGLNKAETIAKYGAAQVELWRRSFAVRPPDGESLEDTFNRTVPYFKHTIEPQLKINQNILVVAHGNSLRALMMYLENSTPLAIAEVSIPTGAPRNYVLDNTLKIVDILQ